MQSPIEINWVGPYQDMVCMACVATWTWDDFYIAQQEANALIASQSDEFVDLVYFMPLSRPLPKGYYGHLLRLFKSYPPNLGMVLWVGCPPTTQAMISNVAVFHDELAQHYGFMDNWAEVEQMAGV